MTAHAVTRHETFQTNLISALVQGVYGDEMALTELLGHGSFGIGTFNGPGGEMTIPGGVCYRLRDDGSVSVPELTGRIPYVVVTNLVPSPSRSLTGPMTREESPRAINAFMPSSNYMHVLRVTGRFAWVSVRTVTKQDRPYRPIIEATDGEEIVHHEDFSGAIAGFRTPLYKSGISVAGCHAHTVDDDRTWGGHLVDFVPEEGEAEPRLGTDFHMRLPLTEEFRIADLSEDMTEEIRRVEHHWNIASFFPEARGRTTARFM